MASAGLYGLACSAYLARAGKQVVLGRQDGVGGACTHPGGSVISINGPNAAMAVLKDTGIT